MNDADWIKGHAEGAEKRRVLIGVTGSIAAYKSAELARLLVSWGYEVRVVMSDSAQKFISPMTMAAVTGNPVTEQFWDEGEVAGIGHIQLADWAQAVVIAPATADFIAKLAAGFADSPLLAISLATRAPILMAPAMNVNMFEHPKTQENIRQLRARGVAFVDPEVGALACGWNGSGRLAHPQEIFYHVRRALATRDFEGKKVVITTGPTREYIDPVRYISNRSSGKMGVALAREAFRRGADVTLVHGPVPVRVPGPVRCIQIHSAQEMHDVMMHLVSGSPANPVVQGHELSSRLLDPSRNPDAVVMAAAVADYRPETTVDHKLKKKEGVPHVSLVKNPDIIAEIGAWRSARKETAAAHRPTLVGFAVETGEIDELLAEVHDKLEAKKVDLIVGNFAQDAFDLDTNRVWLVDRAGRQEEIATSYKSRVANKVLDAVARLY